MSETYFEAYNKQMMHEWIDKWIYGQRSDKVDTAKCELQKPGGVYMVAHCTIFSHFTLLCFEHVYIFEYIHSKMLGKVLVKNNNI